MARRDLFGLFAVAGVGLVVAACGGSKAPPGKAVSATTSSTGTGSTGTNTSGSAAATPTGSGAAVTHVGGRHVASGKALSTTDAQRVASEADGQWRGGWLDSAGHSGTGDVTIKIDPRSRAARAELSFTGLLLGSVMPAQVYEIDLLSFVLAADSYHVASPQFGTVTVVPGGATSATATATAIPGHPEIKTIQVFASRLARRVDLTYTINYTGARIVKGTMAFATGGGRAQPRPLPSAGAAPNPTDVVRGAYAAGLLTAGQVSTIMGSAFAAPVPNGGRLEYDLGIDLSNAESIGKNETVFYRVDLAHTPADMAKFWTKELTGQPNIAGKWKAAYWLASVQSLYVYATDSRGLLIQITTNVGARAPTPARQAQWPALCQKIAAQILTSLPQ